LIEKRETERIGFDKAREKAKGYVFIYIYKQMEHKNWNAFFGE